MGFFLHPSLYISTISLCHSISTLLSIFSTLSLQICPFSLYLSVALSFLSVCFSHLIQFPAFTQNYGILYPAEETSYYTQGNGPLYIERKHGILKGNNTKRKNTKMISLVKAKDDALRVGQGHRCRIHLERTKK